MEIEIKNRKEDEVIDRERIEFRIEHLSEPTPKRPDTKESLSDKISEKSELLTITKIQSKYGRPISDGEAFLYKNTETKEKFGRSYLIERTEKGDKKEEKLEEKREEPEEEEKESKEEKEIEEEKEVKEEKETKKEKEEPEEEGFECPECGKTFDSERGMKIHKGKVH